MSYNGWSNYETWNVALWLSNDEGSYLMCREWAQEAWNETEEPDPVLSFLDRPERATRIVADQLQEYVEEGNPLAGDASLYSDILSANLHEVNWDEIAEGMIEEVETEVKA